MIKDSKSRSAIIDISSLFSASSISQLLRMIRSIIVAKLIGPVMFGTIQGLSIFLLYIPVLQGGYFQSMTRELPLRTNE